MKSVTKIMLFLSVFAIGLASCSKEQKIENQLVKGSGKWNIRNFNGKLDAGSFEFHKDRTIIKTLNLWPETTVVNGTWINDKDRIAVTWSDGKTTVFYITKGPKKNKVTLYETYTVTTFTGWGGPGSHTTTEYSSNYDLERAD